MNEGKFSKLVSCLLAFILILSIGNVAVAAKVDSDIRAFHVRIDREKVIDLGTAIEGGRIVYSTKLGTENDWFGPSIMDAETYKRNGVETLSFTMTEGKTELESLGYRVEGEILEQTSIDNVASRPGPIVRGTSIKPGIVNFTGTVVYDLGGKMILPMQIKVLPKFFITKNFELPDGTNKPKLDFTFSFTPLEGTNAPALDDVTISYDVGEKGIKSSSDLTEIVKDKFTSTGEFTYILKEKPTNYELKDTTAYSEYLTQSLAEYQVTFVVESEPGSNQSGFRILSIRVKALKDGQGEDLNGEKIENYYQEGDENGVRFDNKYNKNIKSDKNKPLDKGLHVSKEVTGVLGDKSAYFPFQLTLTKPEVVTDNNKELTTAKAYIYSTRTNKIVTDPTLNGITTSAEGVFEISYGQEFNFNLKHGEHLVFEEVVAGSKFVAQETDAKGHVQALTSISGGNTPTDSSEILVSDAGVNEVKVVNNKDTSAETGLFTNNRSFILMMSVAGILIVILMIATKKKRRVKSRILCKIV